MHYYGAILPVLFNSINDMPGKVKVRIVSARGLPVMDRSSDLADAFAEVEFKK